MHAYLSTYAYSTATTNDLWSKLDLHRHNHSDRHPPHNHTDEPVFGVARTMSTWTDQEGFPVVIMTPLSDGSMKLRQERYLHAHCCSNQTDLPGINSTWWIPFSFQVYTNATHDGTPVPVGLPQTVLMTEREMIVPNVFHCNDPFSGCEMRLVKANFRQTAFYRVQCEFLARQLLS
jgi:aminopeptidase N